MLALILATLLLQDVPASSPSVPTNPETEPAIPDAPFFGVILSDDPEPPVVEVVERPKPNLPAHALSDPFGWERSQCSPYIRKDEPLEHCQVRVRSDLLAVLGDDLPSALRPTSGLENCIPGTAENNYQIQCKAREMTLPSSPNLQDRVCENRPEVRPDGRVEVRSNCRSVEPNPKTEERRITIFSNN